MIIATPVGCAPTPTEMPLEIRSTVATPSKTPTIPATVTLVSTATQTPFVPRATIKVAVHVPLSGEQSIFGTDMLRAAKLAAQQLAGPLAELGYGIELISYDDRSDTATAESNAIAITGNSDILCGLGHFDSRVAIQASELYHKKALAFISLVDTSTTVTDRNFPEIDRLVGRDDGQGMAGAQFAMAQGFQRVFILGTSSLSSQKAMQYFNREAGRIGLGVVGMFTTDATDSDGAMRRMLAANPDLVYFAGRVNQANRFFRSAREQDYAGAFLGPSEMNNPAILRRAGTALLEGGLYFTEIAAPAEYYPDAEQFIQDFRAVYGSFPRLFAAQAYDAVGLCLKAIQAASVAAGGAIPARAEVASAVRALQDFKGITGTFNFNERGDPVLAKYFVYKVDMLNPDLWDRNEIIAVYEVAPP